MLRRIHCANMSFTKKRTMGREKAVDGWEGFIEGVDAETGKPNSFCVMCKITFKKSDHKWHFNHRTKACKELKKRSAEGNLHPEEGDQQGSQSLIITPPKKTKTSSLHTINVSDTAPEDDQKNKEQLLAQLLIIFNINKEEVASSFFKFFFEKFDPSFNVPPVDDFDNRIFPDTLKCIIADNLKKEILKSVIIYIETEADEDNYTFILGIGMTSRKEKIFLYSDLIYNLDEQKLLNFVNETVIVLQTTYKVDAQFIIYDHYMDLPETGEVNGVSYFILKSFSCLIKKMNNDHGLYQSHGPEQFQEQARYYESIKNFENQIKDYNLGCATKEAEKFAGDVIFCRESVLYMIQDFLKPIYYLAMLLIPSLRSYVSQIKMTELSLFIIDNDGTLPISDIKLFSKYWQKTGEFLPLFNKNLSDSKFWDAVSFQFPKMSTFAHTLFLIPAILDKIDIKKFRFILKKYQVSKDFVFIDSSLLLKD